LELSKTFEPKAAEERWAKVWEAHSYFVADPAKKGRARNPATGDDYFSVVIPPPNVTGQLHLGHALNATLQDVIVRARRMQGFNTLWLVGTDHAGIATQNVVERELAKENRTRHDLGRDAFVARVWQWRETYGGRIIDQLRRLGSSCDYSRERFTLDPGLSRAVLTVFVRLYKEGLIYRDRRLINWCPRCETALSDLEVEHRDIAPAAPPPDGDGALGGGRLPSGGLLYYIKYPFADGSGALTVATTRPETMLGDTAVAVSPEDRRYSGLIGRRVTLPLVGREIPLIADDAVEADFGTGVVKVTPAHDFADFAIGRRHGLEEVVVIDTRGRMSERAGKYHGLSREEARVRILADLRGDGLLERIEPHKQALAVCSRCETVLEPTLSWQWFVKVNPLAERAIAAVRDGRTRFYPRHWENTYFNWLENVHDWCISRQLWWGHRIPAYWCTRCSHLMVEETQPEKCAACGAGEFSQEQDVLDTWFSSALWPFSTLGWPKNTPELKRYYPTSLLVTGFDIIFFWVARMMMMGIYCTGDVPFREVYITPLVRDQYGKKMTKSRGNVIDPLVIMDTYGTDAVRFTLAQLAVQGRDLVLSAQRLAASKAFANKVWNAARFVLLSLQDAPKPVCAMDTAAMDLAARWILERLDQAIAQVTEFIGTYNFNSAALAVYTFAWHYLCDWYVELAKAPLKQGGAARASAQFVLVRCLDSLLRLLHPFMPFLTEELWQVLRPYTPESGVAPHLAVAAFPKSSGDSLLTSAEKQAMEHCIEFAQTVNSLRALLGFHPGKRAVVTVRALAASDDAQGANEDLRREVLSWRRYAGTIAKADILVEDEVSGPSSAAVPFVMPWCELRLAVGQESDLVKVKGLLKKKLNETKTLYQRHVERYSDAEFRAKADPETISETAERADELKKQLDSLEAVLASLEHFNGKAMPAK
jgi:valyl-tRNA synthetase